MDLRSIARDTMQRLARNAFRGTTAGIIGGFLGLVSLFLDWYLAPYAYWWQHMPYLPMTAHAQVINWLPGVYGPGISGVEAMSMSGALDIGLGIAIFAIGCMIVIIWRFGFLVQAAGLFVFLSDFRELEQMEQGITMWSPLFLTGLTSGYMVALAALLISAYGGIIPTWRRGFPTVVPAISRVATHSPNSIRLKH